jgi:hypothetical protein
MMINFGMTGIKAENSLWGCLLKLKGRGGEEFNNKQLYNRGRGI